MKSANIWPTLFNSNKWLFFVMLCSITLLLLVTKKMLIENETAAFEILEQRGEMGIIHTLNGLQYLSIPLIYLWKFTVIAFMIWIGCFLFGYKISFSETWHIVLVCEIIFFIPELLKIIWFVFFSGEVNLFEIRAFYPLSLINLLNIYELHEKWFYPLKALNIFEITYWFMLVSALNFKAKKKLSVAYAIIFSCYVLFFLLWLLYFTMIYK